MVKKMWRPETADWWYGREQLTAVADVYEVAALIAHQLDCYYLSWNGAKRSEVL